MRNTDMPSDAHRLNENGMPMLPVAYVSHQLEGRIRFRVPVCRGDAAYFAIAQQALSQANGVYAVQVNPLTGSILLRHRSTVQDLVHYAEERALFELKPTTGGQEQVLRLASDGVDRLEDLVKRVTQNEANLIELLFVTLLGLSALQMLRGRALGPSTSLLSDAFALLATYRARDRTG